MKTETLYSDLRNQLQGAQVLADIRQDIITRRDGQLQEANTFLSAARRDREKIRRQLIAAQDALKAIAKHAEQWSKSDSGFRGSSLENAIALGRSVAITNPAPETDPTQDLRATLANTIACLEIGHRWAAEAGKPHEVAAKLFRVTLERVHSALKP